jgi:WS/DGAT/MGAT family acyltransferase
MLDPDPGSPPPGDDAWSPRPPPDDRSLFVQAMMDGARRRAAFAADAVRALRDPLGLAGRARTLAAAAADALRPADAVETRNDPISSSRELGRVRRPLEDLKRIKRAFGTTLNDVLLATSAGALRRHLKRSETRPARLKAMVPVSARAEGGEDELGNQLSHMFVELPCDEPDPVRRLRAVHAQTDDRKRAQTPAGAQALLRIAEQAPYPLHAPISRIAAGPRAFNLVVSNIPGPAVPLYMRGCLLEEAYPVVPISDRHSLSIGMTTVRDRACFGLYGDPRSLPDLGEVAGDLEESIDELLALSAGRAPLAEPLVEIPG